MSQPKLSAKASVIVRKPIAEVFEAFADAKAMSQFWFTRRDDGLKQGAVQTWALGPARDAISFEITVLELQPPHRIKIEWPHYDGSTSTVTWTFSETAEGDTVLQVEETGFSGSDEEVIARALDSTGGFNQVIIAAKAWIEHGIAINVVADHA